MELYLHIPFCRSKCRYCDFASWAGCELQMPAYVEAVIAEAAAQASRLPHAGSIDTVFIGGGTPSVLPAALLTQLLTGVFSHFPLAPGAEFTTEANPGTLTAAWLDAAAAAGVNRLSLGMQAYQPQLLRMLGRIHDFGQVSQSFELARAAGISNLSVDLMFGLPGQTPAMWRESLEAALSLQPMHISCYGLIPEPDTPLYDLLERGELSLPDEDAERTMYDDAIALLGRHGFEQYEISNFALPGYACRHNLGYWRQTPYLGLGASAASMLPASWQPAHEDTAYWRVTNPRTISEYIRMAHSGMREGTEQEMITRADAAYETWMLGLRTIQGVSASDYIAMHGEARYQRYLPRLNKLLAQGLLVYEQGVWRMTRRGMDIQNTLLVELMDD